MSHLGIRSRPERRLGVFAAAALFVVSVGGSAFAAAAEEELWSAARSGDLKAIEDALAKGVNVNAKTHYGASALWFAAYKGHAPVVQLLLKKGADPNVKDTLWELVPLSLAVDAE